MATPIIRAPDLRQQVYDRLKENILRGEYPADAKFLENGVAREFGVSRTPAREALALLQQEGVLVQEGRGFRFIKASIAEISDLFEVRMRLEPFAARRAVERSTAVQLREVARAITHELDLHGQSDDYVLANLRVREMLFKCAGNQRLLSAIRAHEDLIHNIRLHTLRQPDVRNVSVAGMRRLVDALEAKDAEAAEVAMAQLLIAARRAMLEWLETENQAKALRA